MKEILTIILLIILSLKGFSNDTTYTKQILKVYEVDRDDEAIYLEFKTSEYHINKDSTFNFRYVEPGMINYNKNIRPYFVKYSKEIIDFISYQFPKVNGKRIEADLSTVLSSQYNENWFCAVFTVFENNRPYQACISFDVMTLYYKKE